MSQRTPNLLYKTNVFFLKTLIEHGFALDYIDDSILLLDTKEHLFQLIEHLHIISTKNNLKVAPEKSFFMLLKVKLVTIQLNQSIKNLQLFLKSHLQLAKLL